MQSISVRGYSQMRNTGNMWALADYHKIVPKRHTNVLTSKRHESTKSIIAAVGNGGIWRAVA